MDKQLEIRGFVDTTITCPVCQGSDMVHCSKYTATQQVWKCKDPECGFEHWQTVGTMYKKPSDSLGSFKVDMAPPQQYRYFVVVEPSLEAFIDRCNDIAESGACEPIFPMDRYRGKWIQQWRQKL